MSVALIGDVHKNSKVDLHAKYSTNTHNTFEAWKEINISISRCSRDPYLRILLAKLETGANLELESRG
jgi:hypothetical protein